MNQVKKENIETIYQLSPTQQGILFESLYAPTAGVYVTQTCVTLAGTVDIAPFQKAWQQVINRHDPLRTLFTWERRDRPLQIVLKQVELPWAVLDWRAERGGEAEEQARVDAFLRADRERGFALDQAPLMRCTLIQANEETTYFVWSHHHILLDGWSLPLIFQEVLTFYAAEEQQRPVHLKKPLPYRNYIAWLQKQDQARAEAFWRRTLRGFTRPTPIEVGHDRREPARTERTQAVTYTLSQGLSRGLTSFAKTHQLTPNTLFQGAWALLLSRYSGDEDVLFGTTVSGRPLTLDGVEEMVGLFINTLPTRVQLSPTEKLLPWLQAIHRQQAEQETYAFSSLVDIQSWSELSPDVAAGGGLFKSILVYENFPMQANLPPQAREVVKAVRSIDQASFPLALVVAPGTEFTLQLHYDRAHFDEPTLERMAGHLQTVLAGMIADAQCALGAIPMLTAAERRQLLPAWSGAAVEISQAQSLHQLFEEQVAQTPDAIAVNIAQESAHPASRGCLLGAHPASQLTYHELNQRANQLAHHLQTLGVGPDLLVALCVERSVEMVVGILAILKAGGAYVPLDPAYPTERLAYILQDTQAPVLLTQRTLADILPTTAAKRLYIDDAHDQMPVENPTSHSTADHLAYVIYTSGSTGNPKGVLISHRNVIRLFQQTAAQFHFNQRDVWTLFHSYAFDFSVWELWGALLYGGRLVVVPYLTSRSPKAFYELLCREQVTVLNQTPSAFYQLMQVEEEVNVAGQAAEDALALRYVIFGGEALDPANLQPWFARHGET
ncbi:MAG: AMP-binding protein, partial [Caldilineaceae bacterium]|nr:AMP-binding protein [Caldilineaceae bacterium]